VMNDLLRLLLGHLVDVPRLPVFIRKCKGITTRRTAIFLAVEFVIGLMAGRLVLSQEVTP